MHTRTYAHAHARTPLKSGVFVCAQSSAFRGIQYSASVANYYTDTDNMPVADWHPRIENVVYYGMDWLCPGYSKVLAQQLTKHHGDITPENTIRDITAITQTGEWGCCCCCRACARACVCACMCACVRRRGAGLRATT